MRRRREPDPPALPPWAWARWLLHGVSWQRALKRLWDHMGTHRGNLFWVGDDPATLREVARISVADWPAFSAMLDDHLVRANGRVIFKAMLRASRELEVAVWSGSKGGNRRVLRAFLREQAAPAGAELAEERLAALEHRAALMNEADRETDRTRRELRGEPPRAAETFKHEHGPMNRVKKRLKGVRAWLGLADLELPPRSVQQILAAWERRGKLELDALILGLLLPAEQFVARWGNRGPPSLGAGA